MERTLPYWENKVVTDSSVASLGRLPINSRFKLYVLLGEGGAYLIKPVNPMGSGNEKPAYAGTTRAA